jgi:hypothetical protein
MGDKFAKEERKLKLMIDEAHKDGRYNEAKSVRERLKQEKKRLKEEKKAARKAA